MMTFFVIIHVRLEHFEALIFVSAISAAMRLLRAAKLRRQNNYTSKLTAPP
jgi:hypothetical protein